MRLVLVRNPAGGYKLCNLSFMLDPIPHHIHPHRRVQIPPEELKVKFMMSRGYYGYFYSSTGVHNGDSPMALILIDAHLSPSP